MTELFSGHQNSGLWEPRVAKAEHRDRPDAGGDDGPACRRQRDEQRAGAWDLVDAVGLMGLDLGQQGSLVFSYETRCDKPDSIDGASPVREREYGLGVKIMSGGPTAPSASHTLFRIDEDTVEVKKESATLGAQHESG